MRVTLVVFALVLAGLASAPAAAQDGTFPPAPLAEPAVRAELTNMADISRTVRQETKDFSPFVRVPAIRIGLMVGADGRASECLAVPVARKTVAYGQDFCPAIVENAEFVPAKDADGNAVRSVYFVQFEEYRPGSAAENRTRL